MSTWTRQAERRWPQAEWIAGDGPVALLAWCQVLTITLWDTALAAQAAKRQIDETACGSRCGRRHEIIRLKSPRPTRACQTARLAASEHEPSGDQERG